MVSIYDTGGKPPVQEFKRMEVAAEDHVGRGTRRRETEEPFHDLRPPSGRTMHRLGPGIFWHATEVGSRVGPRVVPPQPGEEAVEPRGSRDAEEVVEDLDGEG